MANLKIPPPEPAEPGDYVANLSKLDWSPARRDAFEVSLDVLRDTGVFTDVDDDGHAHLMDSYDDLHYPLRAEPQVAAEALARVELAAAPLRRERRRDHHGPARGHLPVKPRAAVPPARSRESRPARARRTSSSTPAAAGDDPGPSGEPPSPALAGDLYGLGAVA